jgi:hypothetical protein
MKKRKGDKVTLSPESSLVPFVDKDTSHVVFCTVLAYDAAISFFELNRQVRLTVHPAVLANRPRQGTYRMEFSQSHRKIH